MVVDRQTKRQKDIQTEKVSYRGAPLLKIDGGCQTKRQIDRQTEKVSYRRAPRLKMFAMSEDQQKLHFTVIITSSQPDKPQNIFCFVLFFS